MLKRENIEYESYLTERPGDARKFARKLTRCCQEPRVIVTVGGDGTMNEVLDGLLPGPMITLGYIPAGSGNDLGRSLGFSRRQVRCLRRILFSPTIRLLDYGVLTIGDKGEHRRFMVSSGIGMDAEVCCMVRENSDPSLLKKMGLGRLEYAAAGLMLLRKTRPVKGYVILDRVKKIEFNHIFFISAHIHPFEGGGFCLAPNASGSDGKLRVCVVSNERRRRILRMLISIFLKRRKKRRKGIRVYRALLQDELLLTGYGPRTVDLPDDCREVRRKPPDRPFLYEWLSDGADSSPDICLSKKRLQPIPNPKE